MQRIFALRIPRNTHRSNEKMCCSKLKAKIARTRESQNIEYNGVMACALHSGLHIMVHHKRNTKQYASEYYSIEWLQSSVEISNFQPEIFVSQNHPRYFISPIFIFCLLLFILCWRIDAI